MTEKEVAKTSTPVEQTPKALKRAADAILFDALVGIGFNMNFWNLDPVYVRRLLQGLSLLFAALSVWSWSHRGGYRWMFTSFGLTLVALLKYWYSTVEAGGGKHIFSPDWRDSFVQTYTTRTNYVVRIMVGYEDELVASIPLSEFKFDDDNQVDLKWLAVELDQKFPMHKFRAKEVLRALHEQAAANAR